jgi:hypothetical protein
LEIDNEGFVVCVLWRKYRCEWKDIKKFGVVEVPGRKMVGFNYVDGYQGSRLGRKLVKEVSGYEGALHDTFGRSAEELAAMLNEMNQNKTIHSIRASRSASATLE